MVQASQATTFPHECALSDRFETERFYGSREVVYFLGRAVVVLRDAAHVLTEFFKKVLSQLEHFFSRHCQQTKTLVTEKFQAISNTLAPTRTITPRGKPLAHPIWKTFCYRPGKKLPVSSQKSRQAKKSKLDKTAATSLGAGICNGGNTCYISSIIQALRYVPTVRECLEAPQMKKIELGVALKNIYSIIEGSPVGDKSKAPRNLTAEEINDFRLLCIAYDWKPERERSQEDARHFQQFLLEQLGFPPFTYKTHVKHNYPYDVDVPALARQGGTENHIVIPFGQAQDNTELSRLVGGAQVEEIVERADIPGGKNRSDLPQGMTLLTKQHIELNSGQIPKILPITLKRHSFDRDLKQPKKVMTGILPSFTLKIPLQDKPNTKAYYTLESIVVHDGVSADSGHYRTFKPVAGEDGYSYVSFDDGVTCVHTAEKIESYIQRNGYIYYYQLSEVR